MAGKRQWSDETGRTAAARSALGSRAITALV